MKNLYKPIKAFEHNKAYECVITEIKYGLFSVPMRQRKTKFDPTFVTMFKENREDLRADKLNFYYHLQKYGFAEYAYVLQQDPSIRESLWNTINKERKEVWPVIVCAVLNERGEQNTVHLKLRNYKMWGMLFYALGVDPTTIEDTEELYGFSLPLYYTEYLDSNNVMRIDWRLKQKEGE